MRNVWVTVIAAWLAGAAMGWWWARNPGKQAAGSGAAGSAPVMIPAVRASATVVDERRSSGAKLGAREQGAADGSLLLLSRLAEMRKRKLLNFHVQVFDFERGLTKEARELWQISESEAAQIDAAVAAARGRIGEMEAERAVVTDETKTGRLVITVPSFPEQGGKVFDEVRRQVLGVLGPERGNLFEELGAFEGTLGQFGARTREIEVSKQAGKDQGTILVKDVTRGMNIDSASGNPSPITMTSNSKLKGREETVKMLGRRGEKAIPPGW